MHLSKRGFLSAIGAAALVPKAAFGAEAPRVYHDEPALLPELPILDPHHHFRQFRDPSDPRPRYLPVDLLADIRRSGHRVVSTIFVECSIMYRPDGPIELRSLGETEYVRTLAEQPESRAHGLAKGMLARIDLTQGERVRELAELHRVASGGRLRGVRDSVAWAEQAPYNGRAANRVVLDSPAFRSGAAALAKLGLVFDASVLHPQLAQLADFARAVPDLTIVLNHLGGPIGPGPDARRMAEVFPDWRVGMHALARQPNVVVKLGGLGQFWENPPGADPSSAALVQSWRPWIETGIEAFGIQRCMFESNFPTNAPVAALGPTYNAFKRIVAGCSPDELHALFYGNAAATYRIA